MTGNQAIASRRRLFRAGMLLVAAPQLLVSSWALLSPESFHDDFPGGGRHWVPPLGPFNEHFILDYGSFSLGLTVAVILAAVWLERRAVQVALVGWLVAAVPHFISHLATLDEFSLLDDLGNMIGLGLYIVIPLALLAMSWQRAPATAEV